MSNKAVPQPTTTPSIPAQINTAISLFQTGKLDEAEALCQTVLRQAPLYFDAIHLLGVLNLHAKKHEPALEYLDRALAIQPQNAEVRKNRRITVDQYNQGRIASALTRHQQGQFALAELIYRSVLQLDPHHFDAAQLLGALAAQRRQYPVALEYLERALAIRPDHAGAHNNRGNALKELKRLEEALASYDRALAIRPDYVEAHNNRGIVLQELQRPEEALASYDQALAIRPDHVEAHYNRGNVLQELQRPEEALASYDRALAFRLDYAEAHNNRGVSLKELKRPEQALASYDRALAIRPDYAEAHNNRGIALQELRRLEEALASYDQALAIRPDYAEAYNNRGIAMQKLLRPEQALACYDQALAIRPDYAEAHWNESLCRLLVGDLESGWQKYEWRWLRKDRAENPRSYPQPAWLGAEDIAGKTILLYAEQGLGDTLQFSRYVPQVAALGATVVLEVPRALVPLFSDLEGKPRLVAKGSKLPAFDFHCSLMSLPLVFGTRLADIRGVPYLRAPADRLTKWNSRIGATDASRIGIVWSGSAAHANDANRSIGFDEFKHLLVAGHDYFCLQKDIRECDLDELQSFPMVRTFASDLTDFADTAALVSCMDVVITVDTSVAHLAGALGKEVWILLPHVPDWRWLLDRCDSPWYDSATLFRQTRAADWRSVLDHVADLLRERLVATRSVSREGKPFAVPDHKPR